MSISVARYTDPGDELPRSISNVSDSELDTIRALLKQWRLKYKRNLIRSTYYDGKMALRPTGNIPAEAMHRIKAVLGWPEKAVSGLADRVIFDGFVAAGQDQDPFNLGVTLDANRFDIELPQAITSTLKHSCAFVTTAKGDTQSDEPDVLILARSAEWATALWDKRRRCVSSALAITQVDADGKPSAFDVYLPEIVLSCKRLAQGGSWTAIRRPQKLREVAVEPLAYEPQLDRPFGRSRISRSVMNITDHGLSTIVRSEISADFYAAPRMAALGVSEDAFANGKWQAAIDRWFAISRDEDGNMPEVKQFPQMTMQPLLEQYRMIASQMAGETGLSLSSLGIITDNPPSAEALYAAEKDLIVKAQATTRTMGAALRQIARKVVMIRDNQTVASDELKAVQAKWVNPAFTSPVTSADALSKLVKVFPWLSESEVALEYAGFSHADVTRLLSDKRRSQGRAALAALVAEGTGASTAPEAAPDGSTEPGGGAPASPEEQ